MLVVDFHSKKSCFLAVVRNPTAVAVLNLVDSAVDYDLFEVQED